MAANTNDSCNRCIDELRARYKSRGVVNNFRQEMSELSAKENSQKAASNSYVLFDARSGIAESYRSGVYKGSKYMTSEDFVRYFKYRRAFYMPDALKSEQKASTAVSTAAPRKAVSSSGREMGLAEAGSKEGHLKTLVASLTELKDKWFPAEPKQGRVDNTKHRIPVGIMSGNKSTGVIT